MEITPAILAGNQVDFKKKVEKVRQLNLCLHLDIMDGIFVPEKTWSDPTKVKQIMNGLSFNAHLMISDPEQAAKNWLIAGANRVYFHYESTQQLAVIIQTITDKKKIGLAINPETPVNKIEPLLDLIASVLVMSVSPGRSGQKFNETALEKINEIRRLRPDLHIAVDGGIKPENISLLVKAGANTSVVGSALIDSSDPQAELGKFHQKIDQK
jgi:ribulose-phosphate 3-epimerase